MAVLSWWDLSGRKIKTMKRFITSVLVQLSSPHKLWEDKMAESHLKPPNGCFMRRKNCSVFSLLIRQYAFYQSFSTISTIQSPQQSQNWQEPGLDSSRFLRDAGRNKSKDLQVYKGLWKFYQWCPVPVNGRKCFLSTHGYKGIHCCISCCQMRHLRMTPTR